MKRKFAALLFALLLVVECFACQSEQDELYSQAVEDQKSAASVQPTADPNDPDYLGDPTPLPGTAYTPVPGDTLAGELRIKTYYWYAGGSNTIEFLAEEFMRLHPGVTIRIEHSLNAGTRYNMSKAERQMDWDNFYMQLRMDLVSGEADYLLYSTAEGLDLDALSRSDVLYDMRSYWESDSELSESSLFLPVIDACKVDGKLTVIPISFSFPSVTFSQRVLEETGIDLGGATTVTSTQLLDWYDAARVTKPNLNLFFTSPGKDELFSVERLDHIDFETRTCSFDTPSFEDFLKRTNAVGNSDPALEELEIGSGDPGLARYWEEFRDTGKVPFEIFQGTNVGFPRDEHAMREANEWFATGTLETATSFYTAQDPLPYLTRPFPLLSAEGKLGISCSEVFSVPTSMPDKELAWAFIQYCLSDREDPTFYQLNGFHWEYVNSGFPVNRENYRKMVEYIADGNVFGSVLKGYPGSYAGIDPEALVAQVDDVLTHDPVYADAYNVDVQEFLDEYYVNGLITAEECAKKIQDRTYMWLME